MSSLVSAERIAAADTLAKPAPTSAGSTNTTTAAAWLASQPRPKFRAGHTLPPLTAAHPSKYPLAVIVARVQPKDGARIEVLTPLSDRAIFPQTSGSVRAPLGKVNYA